MVQITGTGVADMLAGTAGDDIVDGLGGGDVIQGLAGNDILRGGDGDDHLDGGVGDDRIDGGEGNDYIVDESGSDLISAGDGSDNIQIRRQIYRSTFESLQIEAGAGDDSILYYNMTDARALIDAGAGNDTIRLDGGPTGVELTLGAGQDLIDLGQWQLNAPGRKIVIHDFEAGESGDRFSWLGTLGHYLAGWNQSLNPFATGHLAFRQDGADAILTVDLDGTGSGAAQDFIILKNVQASALTAFNLDGYGGDGSVPTVLLLMGSTGADQLTGGGGHDTIDGGDGNDVLIGRGGDDDLRGGDGDDSLDGGPGTDRLEGGAGNDRLTDSSGGSDILDGGAGDDSLFLYRLNWSLNETVSLLGGDGQDRIADWSYGSGTVVIDGGADSDEIALWTSNHSHQITLGSGRDILDLNPFQAWSAAHTTRLVTDFETGAAGDIVKLHDLVSRSQDWDSEQDPFESGVLRLVQRGADAVLQMRGLGGSADYIDLLIFLGRSTVSFTAENFDGFSPNGMPVAGLTLTGTDGADTLSGGAGADVIEGLGGDDVLTGGAGVDRIFGGDGDDRIHGGDGDDWLEGGNGADFFAADHDGGSDTIVAGNGNDFISLYRNNHGRTEHVSIAGGEGDDQVHYHNLNVGGSVVIDLGAGADRLYLTAVRAPALLTLGAGNDVVDFSQFYVSLLGEFSITLADFTVGEDQIVWGNYFANELIDGNQPGGPFASGHLLLSQQGADVQLHIDRDGSAELDHEPILFATFRNIGLSALVAGAFADLVPKDVRSDFNGDGRSDLAWLHSSGAFASWLGQSDGSFLHSGRAANPVDSSWTIAGIGDFNGDGKDDLVWRHTSGAIAEWLGQSDGSFLNNGAAATALDPSWALAGTGDFNGDGRADLAWRHTSGAFAGWLGQADGSFVHSGKAANPVDGSWQVVATGDFNGDHIDDLLWRHTRGTITEWLGQADGSFLNNGSGSMSLGTGSTVLGAGDFNGDGRDDILARGGSGALSEWLGQADGSFVRNSVSIATVGLDWHVAAIADYNGDGRDDLVWRHDNGSFVAWLAEANGGFALNGASFTTIDAHWKVQAPDIFHY